jgi:Kdo2-lipid IVA lauroyltransferase/acyltransferase
MLPGQDCLTRTMAKERSTSDLAADRLSDLVLRGLIGLALALPYRWRVPAMGWLMAHLIGPVAGYRRRAMANLAYIYPNMPVTARRRLALGVLDNAGRTIIENYSGPALARQLAGAQISGPGLAALTEARQTGRPVIFVTAHFGNYEAPRHVLLALGYSIGGLYRPMANPYFNSHYVRTMEAVSGPVFDKSPRGTMGFARFLKRGGMATILFDIYYHGGPAIPFLGQPAPTATSAAEFAMRFNALLIPYFGIRAADGLNFRIEVGAPIAHSDPLQMTAQITQLLEVQIAARPAQWFWVHNRWKPERQTP